MSLCFVSSCVLPSGARQFLFIQWRNCHNIWAESEMCNWRFHILYIKILGYELVDMWVATFFTNISFCFDKFLFPIFRFFIVLGCIFSAAIQLDVSVLSYYLWNSEELDLDLFWCLSFWTPLCWKISRFVLNGSRIKILHLTILWLICIARLMFVLQLLLNLIEDSAIMLPNHLLNFTTRDLTMNRSMYRPPVAFVISQNTSVAPPITVRSTYFVAFFPE